MARSKKDVTVHRENPFMGNGIAYSFPIRQKKIDLISNFLMLYTSLLSLH